MKEFINSPIIILIINVILNLIVYITLKRKIEVKFQTRFSEMYKRKIEIYPKLLDDYYRLKKLIFSYYYSNNDKEITLISNLHLDLINFIKVNRMFISDNVNTYFNQLISELECCFNDIMLFNSLPHIITPEDKQKQDNSIKAINKLKTDIPFLAIEEQINTQITKELSIENIQ